MNGTFIRDEFPIGKRRSLENVELLEGSYLQCPNNWQVPYLRYSYHRLYYIYGGKAYYELNGVKHPVEARHLYMFPTQSHPYGIQHDIRDPLQVLWCHFNFIPDIINGVIDIPIDEHPILSNLMTIWRKLNDLPTPGNEIKLILTTILCMLDRIVGFQFADFPFEGVERHIFDNILRDGANVCVLDLHERDYSVDEIIAHMVGRTLEEKFPKVQFERGEEILRVEHLSSAGRFEDISFTLYKGEVLSLAGLVGAGRTEVAKTIFGAYPKTSGKVYLYGEELDIRAPADAIRCGISLLSEDRKDEGLVQKLSIESNMIMVDYKKFQRHAMSLRYQ